MPDDRESSLQALFKWCFVMGVALLAFLAGSYTTEFERFPYPQLLEKPFEGLRAYRERMELVEPDPESASQWQKVSDPKSGVLVHREDEVTDGYVLFTSAHESAAYLMDNDGEVVHEWGISFREAFPDHGDVSNPVPEHKIHWSEAHLYDNGDLLAPFTTGADTPYGYGLVKVDEDSEVIWRYPGRVHHDVDVREDGTIWALTHRFRDLSEDPLPGGPTWSDQALEDFAVKLSPDGEELARYSLLEIVARYDDDVIDEWFVDEKPWDLLHTNDIDEIGEDFAEHHAFAEAGQLMFSSRSLNAIGLVDPDDGELDWITRGFWDKQHDPDAMPNGEVMIFDNKGASGPGGRSRIASFDPETLEISWSYAGTEDEPFDCPWWGTQMPLENGHVLVSDSRHGRLFEVNRDGELVWDWRSPAIAEFKGETYVANTKAPAVRVDPSRLAFEPQGPMGEETKLEIDREEVFERD